MTNSNLTNKNVLKFASLMNKINIETLRIQNNENIMMEYKNLRPNAFASIPLKISQI